MNQFQFFFPTLLKSGNGLARKAGQLLKPYLREKLLVITDEGLIRSGVLEGFFQSGHAKEDGVAAQAQAHLLTSTSQA